MFFLRGSILFFLVKGHLATEVYLSVTAVLGDIRFGNVF